MQCKAFAIVTILFVSGVMIVAASPIEAVDIVSTYQPADATVGPITPYVGPVPSDDEAISKIVYINPITRDYADRTVDLSDHVPSRPVLIDPNIVRAIPAQPAPPIASQVVLPDTLVARAIESADKEIRSSDVPVEPVAAVPSPAKEQLVKGQCASCGQSIYFVDKVFAGAVCPGCRAQATVSNVPVGRQAAPHTTGGYLDSILSAVSPMYRYSPARQPITKRTYNYRYELDFPWHAPCGYNLPVGDSLRSRD